MPDLRRMPSSRLLFALIMAGLVLWSSFIAAGAYLYNFDPWRPAMVLGCMAVFVGGWLLLLLSQKRKKRP